MRSSVILLTFFLLLSSVSIAQNSGVKVTDSGWRLGLNIGGAYQGKPLGQNDLEPGFGMGWGFTLGRMLYQRPGDLLSVGLRGRFLWETTSGVSTQRQYSIGVDPADEDPRYDLDIVGQRYQDSSGYIYPNYYQEGRQYDLEVTLGLNRLAERTNLLFYVFGGVGVINYQVKTDQLDEDGSIYDYDRLGADPSKDELEELWDGEYETRVYQGGKIDRFISSGGLGLLYQVNRSLGIGIEHKISFPLNEDRFDGKEYKSGDGPITTQGAEYERTSRNDNYHYTALKFRWRLIDREGEEEDEDNSSAQVDDYSKPQDDNNVVHADPPDVDIVDPSQAPYRTSDSTYELESRIRRVDEVQNVTLRIDGQEVAPDHFDPSSDRLTHKLSLKEGGTQVYVQGVNAHGSDEDRVLIIREDKRPEPPAPQVRITDPSADPSKQYDPKKQLEASVLNVTDKGNITFRFNGSSHPFQFDPNSGELKSDLDLRQGANEVVVEASNARGSAEDDRTIIYEKRVQQDPPQVRVVYPDADPHVLLKSSGTVKARTENVDSRSEIRVFQNGNSTQDFNFYSNSGLLTMKRPLDPGNNLFRIKVKNQGGADQDEQRIIFKNEPKQPPKVSFQDPSSSGNTVKHAGHSIEATVENVSGKGQVDFIMNASSRSNFQFDPSSGSLTYHAQLKKGANAFKIKAVNAEGSDQASRTLHYKPDPQGQPPSITIQKPSSDPHQSSNSNAKLEAQVEHVDDAKDLRVRMNGTPISGYNYDPNSGKLVLNRGLVEGRNHIGIRAKNQYGSAYEDRTLIYRPKKPPKANIIHPPKKVSVNSPSYTMKGKLIRVDDAKDVSLWVNKKEVKQFKYDPNSGILNADIQLTQGENRIELEGRNDVGKDRDAEKIVYVKATPPTVDITLPSSDPHSTNAKQAVIKGKVSGVQGKNGLKLLANGKEVKNYQLSGAVFKLQMDLNVGKNKFEVTATNPAGQDDASVEIIRKDVQSIKKDDDKGGGSEKKSSPDRGDPEKKGSDPSRKKSGSSEEESPSSSESKKKKKSKKSGSGKKGGKKDTWSTPSSGEEEEEQDSSSSKKKKGGSKKKKKK